MNDVTVIKKDFLEGKLDKQTYISNIHDEHRRLFHYSEFIKDTDISSIEIRDDKIIMTTRDAQIKMLADKDDKRIIPIEILNFNSYEKAHLKLILSSLNNSSVFFDVGANIGWYTLNVAKKYPESDIHSFEPSPKTYGYLKQNVKMNGIENVQLNNFGLSNEEKDVEFYCYPELMGNASLANVSDNDNCEKMTIHVSTMDKYVEENDVKSIDFIKCDVEGAELFVIQGGLSSIEKFKPIVFCEILRKWVKKFDYDPNDIIKSFSDMNYSCFIVDDDLKFERCDKIDDNTLETNFIFLHSTKHGDLLNSINGK